MRWPSPTLAGLPCSSPTPSPPDLRLAFACALRLQELTPSDVQRMYHEKETLEEETASLTARKDALSSQVWEEEAP